MSDITLTLLGQEVMPLTLSDNEMSLAIASGVTEEMLAQALAEYSAEHDLIFSDDGNGNITVTRGA